MNTFRSKKIIPDYGGVLYSTNIVDNYDFSFEEDYQKDNRLNPEEELLREDLIDSLLSILSEREREILKCRFGLERKIMTLEEIGNNFKLTRQRIGQIEKKALKKLRVYSTKLD